MKALVILAGLLATACNRVGPDPRVCVSPAISEARGVANRNAALQRPRLTPSERAAIERKNADLCLQRWAYRLRKSAAGTTELRTAVMGACAVELHAANVAAVDPAAATGFDEWAARRATFFVVQAKVGDCSAPKA